jgi:uncharacterized protein (TIGR00730 family)
VKRVCVFCGSSAGARPAYAEAARRLGTALARRGYGLVYGGAHVGLMGILADATLAAGGEVIGVIPEALVRKEVAHRGLEDLRVVASMHERKALMADLADAFVALPGGVGTFEEFFEIVTWALLGMHQKPCALLNVEGYYEGLLALMDNAIIEQFLKPEYRRLVLTETDPERLLDTLERFTPTVLPKWINREET